MAGGGAPSAGRPRRWRGMTCPKDDLSAALDRAAPNGAERRCSTEWNAPPIVAFVPAVRSQFSRTCYCSSSLFYEFIECVLR